MLDQSFSVKNLRRLYDLENRKGNNIGKRLPEVHKVHEQVKVKKDEILDLIKRKKDFKSDEYYEKKDELEDELKELMNEKEDKINGELEKISENLSYNKINVTLAREEHDGKAYYKTATSLDIFFLIKHIQFLINKFYKVKQSDRNRILSGLYRSLDHTFPKVIVRTDIKDFYESINADAILEKLDTDAYLTSDLRDYIREIIKEYRVRSGQKLGLPRGVGLSAYLSELYLKVLDEKINELSDLVYYARYVDDIIAVFSPKEGLNADHYQKSVSECITSSPVGLQENSGKQQTYPTTERFNYLGYEVNISRSNCIIRLTKDKIEKIKSRIDATFSAYEAEYRLHRRKAIQSLFERLRYITGNTRLSGSKSNAYVGSYFSNKMCTDTKCLDEIDEHLQDKVSGLKDKYARNKVRDLTFKGGFEEKVYYSFNKDQYERLTAIWRFHAKKNQG